MGKGVVGSCALAGVRGHSYKDTHTLVPGYLCLRPSFLQVLPLSHLTPAQTPQRGQSRLIQPALPSWAAF